MPKDLYVSALFDVYGEFLNEKQCRVIASYYNEDLSLAEIAELEGITRQGVRDLIKRAEVRLYALEKRCGYCEKFIKMRTLAEEIRQGDSAKTDKLLDIIDNL